MSEIDQSSETYLERIKLAYGGLVVSQTGMFVSGIILIYSLKNVIPMNHLYTWFGALMVTILFRVSSLIVFKKKERTNQIDTKKMDRLFIFGVLISSMVWGSAGIFIFPDSLVYQSIVHLVLLGLAGTALGTLTPSFRSYAIYVLFSVCPSLVQLFSSGEEKPVILGLFGTLFVLAGLASAKRFNQNIKEALQLKYESKQNSLKKSQNDEKYRSLYELSEDAMLLMSGNNLFMANHAAAKLLGYSSPEELINTPAENFRPEYQTKTETSTQMLKEVFAIVKQTGFYRLEWLFKRKNGEIRTADLTLTSIEFAGENAILFVARDISKTKELENNLIEANKSKSTFLANMSHEIRTPMNGVLGMVDLMLNNEISEKQKQRALTIKSSANSMLNVINDILDFSKIEAGKLEIVNHDFNINDFMNDFLYSIWPALEEKDLRLNYTCDPEIKGWFNGDSGRIRQVLNNLVNNAIKFTKEGSVSINLSLEMFDAEISVMRFEIIDTGIGISKSRQQAIFERFTQADNSITRLYGGTGLGLSICQQLSLLMGGKIGFESEEGKGSDFWFTVNLRKSNEPVNKENNDKLGVIQKADKKAKVLIVDDNETNAFVAREMLEHFKLKTDTAPNGKEALKKLNQNHYDMILMDCHMPIMDGYQATKEIRKSEFSQNSNNIPIVAFTASAMKGDREKCEAAGMNDYLTKPIHINSLEAIVHKWLNHSSSKNISKIENKTKQPKLSREELIFDVKGLKERLAIDEILLKKVLSNYFESVDEKIVNLKTAVNEQDMEKVVSVSHDIKGATANLSFLKLSGLMSEIEKAAKSDDKKTVFLKSQHIDSYLLESKEEYAKEFNEYI